MTFESLISYIACLFSLLLAGTVLRRDPRSLPHRVFAAGMVLFGAEAAASGINFGEPSWLFLQKLRLGLNGFLPGTWLFFSLIYARQNFRETLNRWKWVLTGAFAVPLALLIFFHPHLFEAGAEPVPNSSFHLPLLWPGQALIIVSLIGYILALTNLEKTLRASVGAQRWQTKFTVFGLGGLIAVHIYTLSQIVLYRGLSPGFDLVKIGVLIFANVLILRSLFRTKFFNAEIYVSQSIVYNSLTILLAGVYFIAVGILAEISLLWGAGERFPLEALFLFLAVCGVAILAFSDRFRRNLKLFISRNFHRPVHDYRKEWTQFAQKTAGITDTEELCRTVAGLVSETFGSHAVSLWLFGGRSGLLGLKTSTNPSGNSQKNALADEAELRKLAEIMKEEKDPIDFDLPESGWSSKGRRLQEDFLRNAGIRYCVSLNAGNHFLGILALGSRTAGDLLSLEDFDLLKTIADQTAVAVRQLELAEELKKNTELESFQRMSAFFVHDLKNLASKLSLTVQNIPFHFENKEFREDAIKTIGQTLDRINQMSNELLSFSKKPELDLKETDVNEIVKGVISGLPAGKNGKIIQELSPLPKVKVDAGQIERVLTNLVLNAGQAVGENGEIQIKTGEIEGGVEISVRDNGCGMSREFMEKSLFRPFKTTKKGGVGIGLYQSKLVVEAHKGKIEASSEEGRGTIFRVYLPGQRKGDGAG